MNGTMADSKAPTLRKYSSGRPPRAAEPIADEVLELLQLAQKMEPAAFQRWYFDRRNKHLDEELESVAVFIAGEWDPDLDTDRLRALLGGGQPRTCINAIVAQMRREVVKLLREQKRRDVDGFIEVAIVED